MDRPRTILLASTQAPELKELIETHSDAAPFTIDLLSNSAELFSQLSNQAYCLLIADLALLQAATNNDIAARSELTVPPLLVDIAKIAPGMAVILLATQDQRSQAITQLQYDAADYILVPVESIELCAKIRRTLELQALKCRSMDSARLEPVTDELSTLREASQEISQTLQLDQSLKIILARARRVTEADLTRVYLADRAGNINQAEVVTDPLTDPSANKDPAGMSLDDTVILNLAQEVASTQKIAYYPNTLASQGWHDPAILSVLIMPMVSRDKLIGVLVLSSKQPGAFSAAHIRWLSIFCDQAAIAIENAYLFQNLSSAYIDLAQSREQILRSWNTLQALFDGITDGLYILDQDLTISALNQVEAERQGFRPDELVGKSCLSLDWAKRAPELLKQIREALHTGQETTWISLENETEPYLKDREFHIYPIRNRLAQIEQVIVFAQDVSERRRWQASLFRSANLAAVGQLAGSVAHQINNPLTITMANSQLLLLEAEPGSETHELAVAIFKASERIQNIIENLLEFSNQETYFFVQTNLINTIEGALALVFRSLKKANIEVVKNYQVQPGLSASISHLKLVWMNLLLNARDAVIDFAPNPRIIISTKSVSEREVAIVVTDNGVGIAAQNFEQLFRPFFTTKPPGRALGLGLYSVHAIVERHHGRINVSSQPGVATTFEVVLPLDNPRDL